jgi:uncharacterized protein YpmS
MTKRTLFLKISILALLVLASISCNLIAVLNPEPTPVTEVVQPPQPDVIVGPAFTYSLTENQLNEYAAAGLQNNPESNFKDLVITLPDGLIDITGQFEQPPIKAELHLIARPYTDGNGTLKIEVIKADLGPLPVGEEMLKTISTYIEGILASSMEPVIRGYRIDSVLITDRVLTLSGQQR